MRTCNWFDIEIKQDLLTAACGKHYWVSKKSCPSLNGKLLLKNKQDSLDLQYAKYCIFYEKKFCQKYNWKVCIKNVKHTNKLISWFKVWNTSSSAHHLWIFCLCLIRNKMSKRAHMCPNDCRSCTHMRTFEMWLRLRSRARGLTGFDSRYCEKNT